LKRNRLFLSKEEYMEEDLLSDIDPPTEEER
jgi:hypothetical protein